jgi:hypothetical protein
LRNLGIGEVKQTEMLIEPEIEKGQGVELWLIKLKLANHIKTGRNLRQLLWSVNDYF